jgi:hypothetical protein
MIVRPAVALTAAVALLGASPATAQIRASERGIVSQTVDGTVITVDYSRPQVRDRDSVFASQGKGIVHWGEVWTPGANWATTLEFSKAVTLNGRDVPAGKYSVWFVPRLGDWTVHLHQNPRLFHTQHPEDDEYFLSLTVTPQVARHAEPILLFSFPRVAHDGTTLRMHWATTMLDLEVGVQPSRPATNMTAEQMAPYLGSYALRSTEDTVVRAAEVLAASRAIRVAVDGWGSYAIELIPTDEPHAFMTAFLKDGKLYDVEDQAPFIFEMQNGRATGFRIMDLTEGKPWMTGTRKP